MTALTSPVSAVTDGSDPTGDALITATVAAHESGIEVEQYLQARSAGLSDREIRDVVARGCPLKEWTLCRNQGASTDELNLLRANVVTNPLSEPTALAYLLRQYAYAQSVGVTQAEFASALSDGHDLPAYLEVRSVGATHAEYHEYAAVGGYLPMYGKARTKGATHQGLIEAHAAHINEAFYLRTIDVGIAHDELMAAHTGGGEVLEYVKERERGYSHDQALANQRAILAGELDRAPGCTARPGLRPQ
jgi:hypothetical protein